MAGFQKKQLLVRVLVWFFIVIVFVFAFMEIKPDPDIELIDDSRDVCNLQRIPIILLYLKGDNIELDWNELAQVNEVAREWERLGRKGWVAVVTDNIRMGIYAKVILHSYGIPPFAVKVVKNIDIIPWRKNDNVNVSWNTPVFVHNFLSDKGVNVKKGKKPESLSVLFPSKDQFKAIVVPGNQPLGKTIPTVDLIRRTLTAVKYYKSSHGCVFIFSGGSTTGGVSEARMMWLIALSRGVQSDICFLDERAYTTHQNVIYSSDIIRNQKLTNIVVVSKQSHLDVIVPLFKKQKEFEKIDALPVNVPDKEVITQMRQYLEFKKDPIVEGRLKVLQLGKHGVD